MHNASVTYRDVVRYFHGNVKALDVVTNKPYQLFIEEDASTIIEMVESEVGSIPQEKRKKMRRSELRENLIAEHIENRRKEFRK